MKVHTIFFEECENPLGRPEINKGIQIEWVNDFFLNLNYKLFSVHMCWDLVFDPMIKRQDFLYEKSHIWEKFRW